MRILIDPQGALSLSRNRGIGRYTRALIKGLIDNRGEHEIVILLNMLFPNEVKILKKELNTLLSPKNFVYFWGVGDTDELNLENEWNNKTSQIMLEKMVNDINPDFFLITSLFEGAMDNSVTSIGNFSKQIPTAVIFYDLIPFIHPQKYLGNSMMNRWYRGKIESLKRADLLLSISHSAREEALEYLHFDPKKVTNISTANDTQFSRDKAFMGVEKKYNITRPFLMHTSAYEERKNFVGLIYAFAFLAEPIRLAHQLVLVCGLKKEQRAVLEDTISALGLGDDEVILTGFAPDEDLIGLYSSCYLFVFPSLHEGFGLPVLEAMSCGSAVIGSNVSSIPEVIGRDDALFNPFSICDMTQKISEVLTNKEFYMELKKHSIEQAKKFDWNFTAELALGAIEAYTPQERPLHRDDFIESIQALEYKPSNDSLIKASLAIEKNEQSLDLYRYNFNMSEYRPTWRIEGPFDSSYSLALLNRETALALDRLGCNVALHSTEGFGDFEPNREFLEENPKIQELYNKSLLPNEAQIISRNLYPPRVDDMNASLNMLHHYAWEESGFPREWVDAFNSSLGAMTTLSKHVQKIMVDNGVSVPMVTSGCGVDHWERIEPESSYRVEAKKFKFLHVSSCFPRKGADVLLGAYGEAFDINDDVSLVIKTFANPHNKIHEWLQEERAKKANFPDVVIIEEDISNQELKALYLQCDALVGPSRAEGFGVPFAEAMLSNLPVITTGWGGQLDFCDETTAWLIDYNFGLAQTHFELFDSVWAEPSAEHLSALMLEVHALPLEKRVQKSQKAKERLLREFTWNKVAQRLLDASKALALVDKTVMPKIGWISSWNSKCGIASYSEHLLGAISEPITLLAPYIETPTTPDSPLVHRCWEMGDGNSLGNLTQTITKEGIDFLVIQFNYSFFDFNHFNDFLLQQIAQKRDIIIMMHATTDAELTPHKKLQQLIPAMRQVSRVLVHSVNDLNRLKEYGLVENVALFPHGILDYTPTLSSPKSQSFVLATYGFFLPHKGLLEIIDSCAILLSRGLDIRLKMVNSAYPVPLSTELIAKAQKKIEQLHLEDKIELITDFLPDSDSLDALHSSDLILFPYQETGESSSASVRYGLASHRPVAVTPLAIFDDVQSASYQLMGTSPTQMANSIEEIIGDITQNSSKAQLQKELATQWSKEHKYSALGKRLFNMALAISRV